MIARLTGFLGILDNGLDTFEVQAQMGSILFGDTMVPIIE